MKYFDLTQTIRHEMPVFPGEKSPSIIRDILPDDASYVTHRIESNMHTGTHIDAPFHVKSDNLCINKYPLEYFTGKALVLDVRNRNYIGMEEKWEEKFKNFRIVLFCTGQSSLWGCDEYYNNYPEFDPEIASSLKRNGVRIAGFDSPSPDKSPFEFHSIFLNDNRFLIENLTGLEHLITEKEVVFTAFPLKIEAEASLIRAVATVND